MPSVATSAAAVLASFVSAWFASEDRFAKPPSGREPCACQCECALAVEGLSLSNVGCFFLGVISCLPVIAYILYPKKQAAVACVPTGLAEPVVPAIGKGKAPLRRGGGIIIQ